MKSNPPQEQQFNIKQRCYYIESAHHKVRGQNHEFLNNDAITEEESSYFCKRTILRVVALIILAVIAVMLFEVSVVTEGYEASIEKIILQEHQNNHLIDQISDEFIEIKTEIDQDKAKTSDNIDLFLSVAMKLNSKLSLLQPKLQILEHKANKLENVQFTIGEAKKKQKLLQMMDMRETLNLFDSKNQNKQEQHQPNEMKFEETVSPDYEFQIPKDIWIYKQSAKNYLEQLYQKNIAYYGNLSEYRVHYVNSESVSNYFDTQTGRRLNSLLELIRQRAPGVKVNDISRKIVLLHFLYVYGGVIVDGPFALTEDLGWIRKIVQNKFCNRGNRLIKPEMVGFFNPTETGQKKIFQILPFEGMQQVNKFTYQFPIFEDYFIASIKKARFLSQVIHKIYEMFDKNNVIFMKDSYEIKNYKTEQAYSFLFFIASKIVLMDKQKEFDLITKNGYKHFAFDYYGLNSINAFYGPLKMEMIYEDKYFLIHKNPQPSRHRIYHDMARYRLEQWQALVGNAKYLFSLTLENSMNKYLEATSAGNDIQIYEGSLLQKLFYPEDKHYYIVENPEKAFTNTTNPVWESLQKYIWVFWYTGIKSSPIFTQACYLNLKKAAESSGFELREVNDQNLHQYLGQEILARIDNSVNGAKIEPHLQTKSNFYRLALLYTHGGIYLDATTLALQNFDWVLNIGKFPSQFLVNRFEPLPKVVMMYHPYFGQPEKWSFHTINGQKNVKEQWHQSLQNGLLIAEKGSEFIGDWLEGMFEVHSRPYMQVQRIYTAAGISKHKSTSSDFHYLIAMDTGKYVIGKKQKQLEKIKEPKWVNAPHYYHLWTFNGYLNPMKLWVKSNYEHPKGEINDLIFKYPLEYVEEIIGKTRFVSKFFGYETSGMNKFIMKNYGNFSGLVHSQSIFMRYVWREDYRIKNGRDGFQLQFKRD